MPTARFSTRTRPHGTRLPHLLRNEWRAVVDVGHLLRFRAGSVRRRTAAILATAFVTITLIAIVAPALSHGAGEAGRARDVLTLLPTAFAAFQVLVMVSGVASGGGRELVPREQLVVHPVSSTTDHLGALLLAPLNIAWLIESWTLLGMAAYGVGWTSRLLPAELGVIAWVLASTAVGQVVAWGVEGIRRTGPGPWVVRGTGALLVVLFGVLQATGRLGPLLDQVPTGWFVFRDVFGLDLRWLVGFGAEVGLFVTATVIGAVPAHLASRLVPRDELRAESGVHRARPMASSDFAMLVRIDRGSIWRAVPMRRGTFILAASPGLVALAGALGWSDLVILPGLVASGGALLFGVNVWCLDERGGLWRESLPVAARTVFAARAWVLAEYLLVPSLVTILIGAIRAGTPTVTSVVVLVSAWLAVIAQVVVAALRWSQRSPYPVDLRSARATPAPPMVMVGYSARLALGTTLLALVFQGLGRAGLPVVAVLLCLGLLLWTALRLVRLRDEWCDPVTRARVVATVAL